MNTQLDRVEKGEERRGEEREGGESLAAHPERFPEIGDVKTKDLAGGRRHAEKVHHPRLVAGYRASGETVRKNANEATRPQLVKSALLPFLRPSLRSGVEME